MNRENTPLSFAVFIIMLVLIISCLLAYQARAMMPTDLGPSTDDPIGTFEYNCPNGLIVDFRSYEININSPYGIAYYKTDLVNRATGNFIGGVLHLEAGDDLGPVFTTAFGWLMVDPRALASDGSMDAYLFYDKKEFLVASHGGFCPLASLDKMRADDIDPGLFPGEEEAYEEIKL